jgi:pimeloyl-ACP methyl ester carboxylesterase
MNQGQWIRTAKNGLNIIFIHGINSSEECWRHNNGSYWPNLLKDESELADLGIYVFSYRTGLNTGSYSLSDIVDSLREYFFLDDLISNSGIIFVCHSMGGIVTRRFLVKEQSVLIQRGLNKIGLFLVASPSLGSKYANMLSLISTAMGHTQANALKFSQSNVWLNDLDKDFMSLKDNENLQIKGKELIEDLPLYLKGFIKTQIVEPFSGAKYFSDSLKVPGSDHRTIATPANRDAIQHRLLVQFVKEFSLLHELRDWQDSDTTESTSASKLLAQEINADKQQGNSSMSQHNYDSSTGYQTKNMGGTNFVGGTHYHGNSP